MLTDKDLKSIPHEELLAELKSRQLKKGQSQKGAAKSAGLPTTSNNSLSDLSDMKLFEMVIESQKVVYGVDDRQEIRQVMDEVITSNADSVVGIFDFDQIASNGDGTSTLTLRSYREAYRLCSSELFSSQPIVSHNCSISKLLG